MWTVLAISAVGLNSWNFIFIRHLSWVEKFPAAVLNTVFVVTVYFRCLTAAQLTSVELAPESKSALRVTYSFFSLFIFNSIKLIWY